MNASLDVNVRILNLSAILLMFTLWQYPVNGDDLCSNDHSHSEAIRIWHEAFQQTGELQTYKTSFSSVTHGEYSVTLPDGTSNGFRNQTQIEGTAFVVRVGDEPQDLNISGTITAISQHEVPGARQNPFELDIAVRAVDGIVYVNPSQPAGGTLTLPEGWITLNNISDLMNYPYLQWVGLQQFFQNEDTALFNNDRLQEMATNKELIDALVQDVEIQADQLESVGDVCAITITFDAVAVLMENPTTFTSGIGETSATIDSVLEALARDVLIVRIYVDQAGVIVAEENLTEIDIRNVEYANLWGTSAINGTQLPEGATTSLTHYFQSQYLRNRINDESIRPVSAP